jgi:hypothetical protein
MRRFRFVLRTQSRERREEPVSDVAVRLRSVARGYQRRMERELEKELEL